MDKKSVFAFNSYKQVMASYLAGNSNRGQMTKAAEALNCQRSYLSRIISEELQLTPDHAFNLARFWRLKDDERDYFLALVDFERAGDPSYKDFVKSRISSLKQKYESVQERTKRTSLSLDAHQAAYFSSWIWSAVHFLTSIPKYQTAEKIAERIGLRIESLTPYLLALEAQGFIEKKKDLWIYRSGEFHAPKDSPLVSFLHQNWRSRAVLDSQNSTSDSIHFTQVQTLSLEDYATIKDLLMRFISESSRIAGPSKPEECIAVTCDLFKV